MPDPLKSKSEQVTEANEKIIDMHKEIVNLYLKIKRCSKDVNLTESQYINMIETQKDKEEREYIKKMDPSLILQFINASIDAIINLKFDDIQNKIIKTQVSIQFIQNF
jgi:hypothetical protein